MRAAVRCSITSATIPTTMIRRTSTQASSLTPLCVGRDEDRSLRHLAWAGSVCALFLAVGIAGAMLPTFRATEPRLREQVVPVVFTAPERPPAAEISSTPPPAVEPKKPATAPRVAPVASYPSLAALAVPADAATVLAPASFENPTLPAAVTPGFTRFNSATNGTSMPQPVYPEFARRRGYQGKVAVNITIAPSGGVLKVELARSSGFKELDDAAVDVVRDQWRFGPGGLRHYFQEINFQLK